MASQMDGLPAPEHSGGSALEKFVGVHIVALRQLAAVGHIAPYQLNGLGKAPLEPGQLRLVGVKVRVVAVPADVVPVDMGGHRRHRAPGQRRHHRRDIADAQPRVNEQSAVPAVEQITVGLLPVAVFADDIGIRVHLVHGEPWVFVLHGLPSLCVVAPHDSTGAG